MPADTIPLLGEEPLDGKPEADDQEYTSVTTVNGVLNKEALVHWAALKTAEAAVHKQAVWRAILESDGEAEAVNWLKADRFRRGRGQRSATELGTAVHKAIEYKAIYGRYRDEDKADMELRPYLEQANRFLREFKPRYVAAELTVYSPTYGYAGTSDGIIEL